MWPSSSLSSWITTNSINSEDFKCFCFIFLENIIRGDEAGFYAIGRFSRSKFIATEFSVQFLLFVLVCFTNFYGWFKKKIASLSTDQITTFLIHSKSLITNRTMLRLFSNDLCSKETCPWYLRQLVFPGRQKRIWFRRPYPEVQTVVEQILGEQK